ncbi:2-polyprenyl-6-methoxyphenol hydroxylase [Nonomuraea sp. NN258]|uniref:FAD-dependent monooxygenase n=1 Tax=Nonomuraea antri TaxID=2730852 RepID=UPI00156A3159|nr:FAD-dependent monooxygenase [Nonomuraea antri]NRQ38619.1 2-polyprenyl-6-methoxyphenol hydroxylase [Nonomuraea antri]
MRVACVGGGPGGLFFAALLKRSRPDAEVVVFERNRPLDTFGFGVVFSDATLGTIDTADPELGARLRGLGPRWDTIDIRLGEAGERVAGMGMSAVVRRTLLGTLAARAAATGVHLRFRHEIHDPAELDGFDLVVVCDGANSRFRALFAADFGASAETSSARFIWFGTPQPFDGLTFVHRSGPHGAFAAHAYPISDSLSTFIVETDADTWARAGLDGFDPGAPPGASDERSRAYLEELFGHPLVGNNSRWARFSTVRTRTWHRGTWVLLGDAAHTAHFSVGSGTKMAMEDAAALAAAVAAHGDDLPTALRRYEDERRPRVERIQHAARPSLSWWEHFGEYARAFEPAQFAFHFLTRSITREQLRLRDPGYVERVDKWWHERHGAEPLEAAWHGRHLSLPCRRARVAGDGTVTAGGAEVPEVSWIDAPAAERDLPGALARLDAHHEGRFVGVRGGTALTRLLVAQEARLNRGLPVLLAGPYDADAMTTLVLSGRADLVAAAP